MDPFIWLAGAVIVAVVLFSIPYIQRLLIGNKQQIDQREGEDNGVHEETRVVGGVRRTRNVRARHIIRNNDDEVDNEQHEEEEEDDFTIGKIGTKKLRKLQAKAERKAMREQEEAMREDRKRREALREEERKKQEEEDIARKQREEEEQKRIHEEQEKKDHEEYLKLKQSFIIEEEGQSEERNEGKTLTEFIKYIKQNKVIFLEDLAAEFHLRTQDIITRIQSLQESRRLTGVIDDRGKFIYISIEELQSVAKFIKQRGRVSISELAQSSNSLISLQSDTI